MRLKQSRKALMNLDVRIHGVLAFAAPHPQALAIRCDITGIIWTGIRPPLEDFASAEASHRLKELLKAKDR